MSNLLKKTPCKQGVFVRLWHSLLVAENESTCSEHDQFERAIKGEQLLPPTRLTLVALAAVPLK